jgi:hypothetical protein
MLRMHCIITGISFLLAATGTLAGQNDSAFVITPSPVLFGAQTVGTTGQNVVVRLANTSTASTDVEVLILPSSCGTQGVPSPPCSQAQTEEILSYTVQGSCAQLSAGQSCMLTLTFAPKVARKLVASIFVQSATGFLGQAQLIGTGTPGQLVSGTAPAIEFYNGSLDHYFMTHVPDEIAKLDSGAISGWERTGYSFWVWPDLANAPAGAASACRFYGIPEAGLDSHFYTLAADECSHVIRRFSSSWILESGAFFSAFLPNTSTGECPTGSRPIHRLYNDRADANHRYLPFQNLDWVELRLLGWIPEGYGSNAVVMCGAPGVFAIP